jgi:hypothetical protein
MSQQQAAESLRLNDTAAAAVAATTVTDTLVDTSSAMLTHEELTSQHALAEGLQTAFTVHNSAAASCGDSSNGNSITAAPADATDASATTTYGNHSASISSVIVPMARYYSCWLNATRADIRIDVVLLKYNVVLYP